MPQLTFTLNIKAPIEEVWAFHESVESLFVLTPPYIMITLEEPPETARQGVLYALKIRRFGIPVRWLAEYTVFEPPHRFVDRQVKGHGPFTFWQHEHRFEESPAGTLLTDTVTYTPPFGLLGRIADKLLIRRDLVKMFAYRHKITKQQLESHKMGL
jgi:ligand-binding SRPBCC domain-containing protein